MESGNRHGPMPTLFLLSLLLLTRITRTCSHVYTDSFPRNEEYDFMVMDPESAYGSPYGGYSRATASRLASLPLRLPNLHESLADFEPFYMEVRDSQGRPFVCRSYHEDELEKSSLIESMFDTARLLETSSSADRSVASSADDAEAIRGGHDNEAKASSTETLPSLSSTGKELSSGRKDNSKVKEGEISPETTTKKTNEASDDGLPHDPILLAMELNTRLTKLNGMCTQYHHGWWSYEWCYKKDISQFHVNMDESQKETQKMTIEDETSLGKFSERTIQIVDDAVATSFGSDDASSAEYKEIARVVDVYTNGDICPDTGKPRVTESVLRCCPHWMMKNKVGFAMLNGNAFKTDLLAMQVASEDRSQICHYNITLCTPLLCKEQEKKKNDGISSSKSNLFQKNSRASASTKRELSAEDVEKMSVLEILEWTFDPNAQTCLQTGDGGWWVYELCPGKHVRQFHEVTLLDRLSGESTSTVETQHFLGKYDTSVHAVFTKENEWQNVVNASDPGIGSNNKAKTYRSRNPASHGGNGAYYFQEYTKGDVCDHTDVTDSAIKAGEVREGGIERATTVRYSCGNPMSMVVKEDSTCHYVVDVAIPALCDHPLFRAPLSKKQILKCLPAF